MPQVTMPQLGEGVEEGTIGKWLKSVGDHVRVGDPLVEVVTDKVNAEVPSPFEGTLTKILVAEGQTIGNDVAIAELELAEVSTETGPEEAAQAPAAAEVATTTAEPPPAAEAPAAAEPPAAAEAAPTPPSPAAVSASAPSEQSAPQPVRLAVPAVAAVPMVAPANVRMTPAVRRLARELRVDVTAIAGSGLGGRITRADIEAASSGSSNGSAAPAAPSAAPVARPTSIDPADSPVKDGDSLKALTPMRKAIAAHMTRFLEVPAAYITIEVDMTPVVRARTALNPGYQAREGMSLSYVGYVTKACVEALRRYPDFNAHWTPEGHWRRKAINIGIAVAVEDGLVVPVIHGAENLSLHGLNLAINDLARRARDRKLTPQDLEGGTFTVDNTGWTGSILTLPIINVPEVAIITMEKIVKRPVVLEAMGDAIAVRSMMNMCIAIDHRATDGAQAGAFLGEVQAWLGAVDEATPIW